MIECSTPAAGVTELRLNRPPVNALSAELLHGLASALAQAESEARAVVLSGRPGIFSAGLDVPLLVTLDRRAMRAFWETFFTLLAQIARFPLPVCFAITGHSPAGGTVLSLFGDYRVAAAGDFRLGLNETEVGLPMPPVVFRAFRRLVGTRAAEQLAVAGRLVGPGEALALGLVDEVVEPTEVVARAVGRAAHLAALPQHALSATRAEARADLVALFDDIGPTAYDRMNAAWFAAETQAALREFLARLAARGASAGA